MNNCARCLESNIETPAVYFAKITKMFYAPFGKMINVDNDGATLCHGCLEWTRALPEFRLEYQDLATWLKMSAIDKTAVWEVNDGDDSFHACYKCAYDHAVRTVGIHADLELGKNFSVEEQNFSISEDVFGEHADCSPICAGCQLELV